MVAITSLFSLCCLWNCSMQLCYSKLLYHLWYSCCKHWKFGMIVRPYECYLLDLPLLCFSQLLRSQILACPCISQITWCRCHKLGTHRLIFISWINSGPGSTSTIFSWSCASPGSWSRKQAAWAPGKIGMTNYLCPLSAPKFSGPVPIGSLEAGRRHVRWHLTGAGTKGEWHGQAKAGRKQKPVANKR